MGCPTPKLTNNKNEIEKQANADKWAGKYLAYGSFDYASIFLGICIGAIATYMFCQAF